jgi:phage terminase small subunit
MKGGDEMAKLTDKQEKFVQELIKGKSQRESYRIAYPRSVNWKDDAVDQNASKLLKHTKVLPRYEELKQRLIKEAEDESIVEAKDVLREFARIAFADVTDYANIVTIPRTQTVWNEDLGEYETKEVPDKFDQFVVLKDTVNLKKRQSAPIKSIKQGRHGIEIELYPKDKSLEMLGKTLSMFKDQIEISGQVNNPMEGLTTEELKKLIYDE